MDCELRIEQIRKRIIESKARAFITERALDLRYFCGTIDPRGLLVIPSDGDLTLFVPAAAVEESNELVHVAQVQPIPIGMTLSHDITKVLRDPGLLYLGEVSEQTRLKLQSLGSTYILVDHPDLTASLQRHKSTAEIAYLQQAVAIAEIGIQTAIQSVKVHITELEVAAKVTQAMMLAGAESTWFPAQVLTGRRSVFADAKTSRKPIDRGDLCIVDVGPLYEGYTGDLTRSFALGKLTPDQRRQLEWTQEAQHLALNYVREGVAAKDLYHLVSNYFDALGVAKYFPHALGHGLGLLSACPPYLRPDVDDTLLVGDVITFEPGLYIPGIGGCRIEDVVIVTKDGFEWISHLSVPWEID